MVGDPAEVQVEIGRLGEDFEGGARRPVHDIVPQQAARLCCVTPAQRLAARPEGVRRRAGHGAMLPPRSPARSDRVPVGRQAGVGLAQLALEDLAAGVLRQRVGEDDVLRALVAGQLLAGVRVHVLRGERRARAWARRPR